VKLLSVDIEHKYLTRKCDILEVLNQHIISVGPNLAKKITAKPDDDCLQTTTSEQKEMRVKTISSMNNVNEIKKLRIGKAASPDNIHITYLVRDVGDLLAKQLQANLGYFSFLQDPGVHSARLDTQLHS